MRHFGYSRQSEKLMGLFDQIINAIDDPNQQASSGQLANIFNTTQQLSNT